MSSRQGAVPAAVAFLSVHGNAERFLATHRADERGRCTGCFGDHPAKWPCTVARLLQEAIAKRSTRPPKRLAPVPAPSADPAPATDGLSGAQAVSGA